MQTGYFSSKHGVTALIVVVAFVSIYNVPYRSSDKVANAHSQRSISSLTPHDNNKDDTSTERKHSNNNERYQPNITNNNDSRVRNDKVKIKSRKLQSPLSIQFDLVDMSSDDAAIFESAANRWSSIIYDDLPDYDPANIGFDPEPGCTYPDTINDLYICGKFDTIDGPGKVLGFAGPDFTQNDNPAGKWLPVTGSMVFDSEDIDSMKSNNYFESVIQHEMGHILGIGTLWKDNGVVGRTLWCPYRGRRGNQVYRKLSGCVFRRLPTERGDLLGNGCGHFSEKCFRNELMTPNAAFVTPISELTIATLEDIGYTQLDYSQADPFTSDDMNPRCLCKFPFFRNLQRTNHRVSSSTVNSDSTSRLNYIDKEKKPENPRFSNRRRELSAEGRKYATDYGIKLLQERKKRLKSNTNTITVATMATSKQESKSTTLRLLDTVTILYYEDGQIHDVHVSSD